VYRLNGWKTMNNSLDPVQHTSVLASIGGAPGFRPGTPLLTTPDSAQIPEALPIALNVQDPSRLSNQLREEKAYLEEQLRNEWRFDSVIGMSTAFRDETERVRKLAPGNEAVLIIGEDGTEKELIARLIHQLSPRHPHTFVKVNCAGYPAHILAKKLFGYEKTAPCGTSLRRMGRLELAHSSTLFLEEVADLPLELQSRLALTINENGPAESDGPVSLDVRLVASTSRNLTSLANPLRFNRDLYQLLTVLWNYCRCAIVQRISHCWLITSSISHSSSKVPKG
jgi:formate hydrogenlyase transcriptional activator